MPLVPLLPLFHRLNREHFDGSLVVGSHPLITLRWSDGRLRKTAGFYRRWQHGSEVVLSQPLLELLPKTAIESTLCHEMIHAWIDLVLKVPEGHGPNFYSRMAKINTSQAKFQVSVRHQFPVPITPPKWWAVCPSCGTRSPYKRRLRGVACKKCCNNQYGGKWHPNCLLKYEPILEKA